MLESMMRKEKDRVQRSKDKNKFYEVYIENKTCTCVLTFYSDM
jgi:adenylylsulfate kinase-like enzyme